MTDSDNRATRNQSECMSLILLGGLPGSGKSCHLRDLKEQGWKVFDDFQAKASHDSDQFGHSRRFEELISDLKARQMCVVADIRVVHAPYRASATAALRRRLGAVQLEIQLFENNPEQCAHNVRLDTSRDPAARLSFISYAAQHSGAPSRCAVRPQATPISFALAAVLLA